MKNSIAILLAACALTACQTTTESSASMPAGMTQIATQNDMSAIAGKTLTLNAGQTITIANNGTIAGSWDGTPVAGTYEMKDGYFCRTLSAGPRGPSPEDCQLFMLEGNKLTVTRDRGNGSSFVYTVS